MKIRRYSTSTLFFFVLCFTFGAETSVCDGNDVRVSSPFYSDSAGTMGQKGLLSVFRIIIPKRDRHGTGFLHKSGTVLTAAHLVSDCAVKDVLIRLPGGKDIAVLNIISDEDTDISCLTPTSAINGNPLPITNRSYFDIGAKVSTWGFPFGYGGQRPMLSVGYLSGIDTIKSTSGMIVKRWVVNAAFNSGNSGGPLIDTETGLVIGIVSSKLAPIPPSIEIILTAMRENKMGTIWKHIKPDGTIEHFSQDQMLERVIQYLQSQTQLVVGHAVLPDQLNRFIKSKNLDPTENTGYSRKGG
jgi:S1-C subfamily serine protease